ncbi:hypothetical protein [Aliagarivorans marinus]|uniref:hypothetical protein n=1 Tax=Aliagarivorans marinus TaxID=561965 RepID=UPI0004787A65|nr:hypothetical protein [Aliagarivorans marinus]
MKSVVSIFSLLLLLAFSGSSSATHLKACQEKRFTLESVTVVGSSENLLGDSYNASNCIGVIPAVDAFLGNNDPNPNLGQAGDGLLNGESPFFDGMEFITEDQLQDIDGDGEATDPGWIHLATTVLPGFGNSETFYNTSGPYPDGDLELNIDDLLDISFDCRNRKCTKGTWTLTTDPDIVAEVQELLGAATFDHLAFSINVSGGFLGQSAIYDFNFADIFANEDNDELNFFTAYELSGSFNTKDFWKKGDKKPLTLYINTWARDPQMTSSVSEPLSMALFGSMLLMLGYRRRQR